MVDIRIKKVNILRILFSFFFLISFFFVVKTLQSPTPVSAQCYTRPVCGGYGPGGCTYTKYSGYFSCKPDGVTQLWCDPGPCGSCTPSCPAGYGTSNNGCPSTVASCTRRDCHGSCGTSTRTCWKVQNRVTYNANTGSCSPATRDVCLGSASAAPSCSKANHHIASYSVSGSCTGFNSSTGSCSAVNGAVTITANWAIDTRTVTFNSNGGTCDVSSRTVNHGESAAGPSCTRPEYNLTDFSITSGSCAETFDPATGSCSEVTTNITIQANWEIANVGPNKPTAPRAEGQAHPARVATTTPTFSVVFEDPNPGDHASQYQIQVNTQPDFNGTTMWDTSLTNLSGGPGPGFRNSPITYAGSTLALDGTTYYWRMRLADSYGLVSEWCTCSVCEFTMNQEPTAPTQLLAEASTNPVSLGTLTPSFSAIFNDPDTTDSATQYQIQVNTASDFSGTQMWDSSLQGMTATLQGSRSPDIEYNGTALSFDGSKYYWRIRFADEYGTVGAWSSEEANFTMNKPPTAPSSLLTENSINPTNIAKSNPVFTAVFNDPDITDTSSNYQIQINTNGSFTGSTMWDSSKTSMTETSQGQRSPEIQYNGSRLIPNGATYYWRIKFWDTVDSQSPWSSTATFSMEANSTPTAPTGLLVDGKTNHPRVNNYNPVFTAIFNDPNTFDLSEYYQVQVNTQEDFAGTIMWDSGKVFMNTINKGERCEDITYAGSTLSLTGVKYYWRIKFWDASDVASPWGAGNFTTSGAYTVFEGLRLGGNLKLD